MMFDLYTTAEMCAAVPCSRQALYRWRDEGRVAPAMALGDHTTASLLWSPSDVEPLQQAKRVRS